MQPFYDLSTHPLIMPHAQLQGRTAYDLVTGKAEDGEKAVIDINDLCAVGIGEGDCNRAGVEYFGEAFFTLAECLLGPLTVDEVADDHDPHCAPLIQERLGPCFDRKGGAVFAQGEMLVGFFVTGAGAFSNQIPRSRGHTRHHVHAGQRLYLVAQHVRELLVGIDDLALFSDADAFKSSFSEPSKSFETFPQGLLGSMVLLVLNSHS